VALNFNVDDLFEKPEWYQLLPKYLLQGI
jgi:hypothetical protein